MRFKKVYIEILNSCNLQCQFCIQNKRPKRAMTIEEFKHILKEIKPYSKYVYLHVLGEPLLHPNIVEFLELCKQMDIFVNITTNGTLLKQRIHELKSCSIRQLNISLHSFSQHHQRDYLKDIMESVEMLSSDTYISYRLWSLKQGVLEKESQQMMEALFQNYQVPEKEEITSKSSIVLKEHVYLNFDEVFEWPSLNHAIVSKQGSCRGYIDMCAILVDGRVVPCCLDSYGDVSFGNIYEASFKNILESERSQVFLQHRTQNINNEELCQKCEYRTRFDRGKYGKNER